MKNIKNLILMNYNVKKKKKNQSHILNKNHHITNSILFRVQAKIGPYINNYSILKSVVLFFFFFIFLSFFYGGKMGRGSINVGILLSISYLFVSWEKLTNALRAFVNGLF